MLDFGKDCRVTAVTDGGAAELGPEAGGASWSGGGVRVACAAAGDGAARVTISARGRRLYAVRFAWAVPTAGARVFGDEWERAYGETQWEPAAGCRRAFPWYLMLMREGEIRGFGVAIQPNALACWRTGPAGVALELDLRAGSNPLDLCGRELEACTLVDGRWPADDPFAAACAFCARMAARGPASARARAANGGRPVYGYNDWYCAYGRNTAANFLADAAAIGALCPDRENRPFAVVDDGWQPNNTNFSPAGGTGPWDRAADGFGMSMPELAAAVRRLDMKPGLWYRPFWAWKGLPDRVRMKGHPDAFDPTLPETRRQVREDIARFREWGFALVKCDFMTWDLCGRWGFELDDRLVTDARDWADATHTTAETVLALYREMRAAAGDDMTLIGCNALNHLAAGVFDVQRTGDDTSGREWDRTRRMGVNALAARLCQHGAFFQADADCVGLAAAGAVPWEKNRQWLRLVSESGTPLFVSWKRDLLDGEVKDALREAFAKAAAPRACAPLDWTDGPRPRRWKTESGELSFDW